VQKERKKKARTAMQCVLRSAGGAVV